MKGKIFTLTTAVMVGILSSGAASALQVSFSTGPAAVTDMGLIDCGSSSRVSAVGEITSDDRSVRIFPAEVNYKSVPHAPDLCNECAGVEPDSLAQVDISTFSSVDAGNSEEFTAYVFADNYFKFYVNGTLIGVDSVRFTPFNSSVVKFTADRPLNLAVMGDDWEKNLGLGSEAGRGSAYFPGDAGIVMHIQDNAGETVAITDTNWRAQTFYTSTLTERNCLIVDGQNRDSSACSTDAVSDGSGFSAAFWDIPDDWMLPEFDDSA